jgi:hypothetical protein
MRRRELKRLIHQRSIEVGVEFRFKRQGSNHEIFTLGSLTIVIGRHKELKPGDVSAILNETELELGEKWWR